MNAHPLTDNIIDHLPENGKLLDERTTGRIVFLRKLYALLALQYAVAFVVLVPIITSQGEVSETAKVAVETAKNTETVKNKAVEQIVTAFVWIQTHKALGIALLVLQAVLALVVFFLRKTFRKVPLNIIAYIVWTLLLAYNIVFLTDKHAVVPLLVVSLLTLNVAILFYALTTRLDLTLLGGTIYVLGSALFSYLGFLIATTATIHTIVLLTLAVIIVGFYLIYDTKYLIIGQSLGSQQEDPFVGSIVIYTDMVLVGFRLIESLGKLFKRNRF